MTVVWFSKHQPTRRQRTAMRELFGPQVRILRDRRPFDDAQQVVTRFRRVGADEMVIVAPLAVIRHIVMQGIHPIWAEMRICKATHPHCEVHINNRHYRFSRFARITGLTITTEPIKTPLERQPSEARSTTNDKS
jgi:hypothetical protein